MGERKRATGGDRDGTIALVLTIAVNAALAFAILQLRPGKPAAPAADDAIRIEFITRPRAARPEQDRALAPEPARASSSTAQPPRWMRTRRAAGDDVDTSLSPKHDAPALDLHVREHPPAPLFQPRDAFARRPVIDARRTRFQHAWAPAGNVLDQARFRSKSAAVVLGLFGGPPRRCSEVERRLRKPDCLPASADEIDDEILQRGGSR